jgi:DNA polymerase I-like protein with 3'-5' exonuclease and polymerase domains
MVIDLESSNGKSPVLLKQYLTTTEEWDKLVRAIERRGVMGLDTEFYNVDIKKQSTVLRAKIHVWSVAIRSDTFDARGYTKAVGFVLPVAALEHSGIRRVLESRKILKAVHNQPVDSHALHNHGIQLRGALNTLNLARWVWPEMNKVPGYTLKSLMTTKLGREPICTFKQLVSYTYYEPVEKWKQVKRNVYSCGRDSCRKRNCHSKSVLLEKVPYIREYKRKSEYPLETIVPGHTRFSLLVNYAAEDAIAALELLELALRTDDPAPYPYPDANGNIPARPGFSQVVEEALIEMERNGFRVDVGYCEYQSKRAAEHERETLNKLFTWHHANVNSSVTPPTQDLVDAIWSSPKQLIAFLDSIKARRSPIWKKGLVKRGTWKTDSTALDWVRKIHLQDKPHISELIALILHLRKIRSGKKYVDKLPRFMASDGFVHPVCGPAGDSDDSVGAVSGRLGMKNPEGQQLPKPDEEESQEKKDLYCVRRAIIA